MLTFSVKSEIKKLTRVWVRVNVKNFFSSVIDSNVCVFENEKTKKEKNIFVGQKSRVVNNLIKGTWTCENINFCETWSLSACGKPKFSARKFWLPRKSFIQNDWKLRVEVEWSLNVIYDPAPMNRNKSVSVLGCGFSSIIFIWTFFSVHP